MNVTMLTDRLDTLRQGLQVAQNNLAASHNQMEQAKAQVQLICGQINEISYLIAEANRESKSDDIIDTGEKDGEANNETEESAS